MEKQPKLKRGLYEIVWDKDGYDEKPTIIYHDVIYGEVNLDDPDRDYDIPPLK